MPDQRAPGYNGHPASENRETMVCGRCVEVVPTTRCQELAKYISDVAAIKAIARLIAMMAAEKLGLHSGPRRRPPHLAASNNHSARRSVRPAEEAPILLKA